MGKTYLPIAVMGFIVAVAAGAAAVCAALGNRWGFWDYRTGLLILKWAAYGGAVGAVIALIGGALAWLSHSHRGLSLSLIGLLIALVVLGIPWQYRQQAGRVPPIHDITTDVSNPPRFVAILPLRKSAINTTEYGGPAIAAQQRAAYPDIVPLELALPPAESFKKALAAAQAYGIKAWHLRRAGDVDRVLKAAMEYNDGPCVIEAEVVKEDNVFPMIPAGAPLANMIIDRPKQKMEKPSGST